MEQLTACNIEYRLTCEMLANEAWPNQRPGQMMSSDRVECIQDIFLQAIAGPSDGRYVWLRQHCGDNQSLLEEVNSLLAHHQRKKDPLEEGLAINNGGSVQPTGDRPLPVLPGYAILREIDTGGHSVVYEAIQNATTQRVAIKMLRWGSASTSNERKRFDREVSILSQLKHPNILSIFDRGETENGTVFLVTEFVQGLPIDRVCESSHSEPDTGDPMADVLGLFLKVALAVDFAHRAGIIHRDPCARWCGQKLCWAFPFGPGCSGLRIRSVCRYDAGRLLRTLHIPNANFP